LTFGALKSLAGCLGQFPKLTHPGHVTMATRGEKTLASLLGFSTVLRRE
jgi:hypothetical protein